MISFIHPNGDRMEIEAPLPQDFKNALALFEGKDV